MEKKYILWNKGTSFVAGSFVFVGAFAAIFAAILLKAYLLAVLVYCLALLLFWGVFKRDRR